jgi:hypothetical protein
MPKPPYAEHQRFPPWVYLVVAISPLVGLWGGRNRATWLVGLTLGLTIALLLFVLRLDTAVDRDAVRVRFFPFRARRIPFDDIERVEAVTYSPLREYGGWGIRGTKRNRAYNTRGKRGVRLVLRDGSRLLIGSQRPDGVARAIEDARSRA